MRRIPTCALLLLLCTAVVSAGGRVLFDDFHAQSFGNADWTIRGAYSEMADVLEEHGYEPISLSRTSLSLRFTSEVLDRVAVAVLPEPNRPYTRDELRALEAFVRSGGGLFMIADHGGSDRDFDGWDSAEILDELGPRMGLLFVGDTFTETPVAGRIDPESPITRGIRRVGAWAATSLEILPDAEDRLRPIIQSHDGRPYLVAGTFGLGRIAALGDSSPFDDGTGLPDKKLHPTFRAPTYDHPQLALNVVAYLAGDPPPPRLADRELPEADRAPGAERWRNVLIDARHGNAGIETLSLFRRQMERELGWLSYFGFQRITSELLERFRLVVLVNPARRIEEDESAALSRWVRAGGRLLLISSGARAPQNGIREGNRLLEAMGSRIRFNHDEILDRESNAGKRWAVLARTFTRHWPGRRPSGLIAWRCGSLITPGGVPLRSRRRLKVLYRTQPTGWCKPLRRDDLEGFPLERPDSYPIAALERIRRGRIVVVSVLHLGDYQYPEWERYPDSYVGVDHETPAVNRGLLELLR